MLPNREGRFKATLGEHGVSETGQNHLATFVCEFNLIQELINGQWCPVDDVFSITGYFYLEKRDGSLNTVTIDQLKAAFGWDGRDPFWLQDTDFIDHVVQLKLAFEEYAGKTRIKVQYVDPENGGSRGVVPTADDSMRRSICGRLGSRFRANSGGVSVPPMSTATATMDQAWQAFTKACPEAWKTKEIEAEWFRVLNEMFPGHQPDQLSGQDWAKVLADGPGELIPI